ncbi:hypothetical protein SDJN03_21577, partial [Cucurbita argyrosperma subsp. sororia]
MSFPLISLQLPTLNLNSPKTFQSAFHFNFRLKWLFLPPFSPPIDEFHFRSPLSSLSQISAWFSSAAIDNYI